jgi:hypothetical protein
MPNWCNNSLSVFGPPEDVKRFQEKAHGSERTYYGPLNDKGSYFAGEEPADDSVFVSLLMELMMKDEVPTSEKNLELSFHALYPIPREVLLSPYDTNQLEKAKKKYPEFYQKFSTELAGYDWEYRNWGTKWGACEVEMDDSGVRRGEIFYHYDTAWGPPSDNFFQKVSKDFPTLTFKNQWGGDEVGSGGYIIVSNGNVVESDEWDEDDEDELLENDSEEPFFEEGEEYQHDETLPERES